MYLEYYSLDRPPFRITPDPTLFFTGGANGRGVVLEALLYAVQSGEGILKVVGEVGSGKTMLCRMLEERLPESVEVVYLANPKLTPHEILYAVAFELRLPVTQETPRLVLMQNLQTYLLKQHAANRSVLVIIEEAQSMPMETLEEIRLFSNLETHQHKLMQIILFGQPELDNNLQNKDIRQLRERITHSFYLRPLTTEEVSDYIRYRLQAAGCPAPQVFSKSAEKLIAKASGGLTRRINILADKAMLAAYSDSATATRPRSLGNQLEPAVTVEHVKAAIRDSDYKPENKYNWWVRGLATSIFLLVCLVAWLTFTLLNSVRTQPFPSQQGSGITEPQSNTAPPATAAPLVNTEASANIAPQANTTQQVTAVTTGAAAAIPVAPDEATVMVDEEMVAETIAETPVATGTAPVIAAATPEVDTAEEPVTALPAIITARRDAFIDWIDDENRGNYALQILSIAREEIDYVARALESMSRSGLLDSTFTCLAPGPGGSMWRIVYGNFDSVEEARASIELLPRSFQLNIPFVQNVNRLDCL